VVDDEPAVRRALGRLLRAAGFAVEEYGSAEEFLHRPPFDGPGCMILDLRMPGLTGLDLQARLAGIAPDLPVVFLTGHGDVPASVEAMKGGAEDFLTKPVDEGVLLEAVGRGIERHRAALSRRRTTDRARERLGTLTPREMDVLRHVIAGALNKQIAAHLRISEKTVKVHRGRVMDKTGAGSVADLVRLCALAGVEPARPGS
jgi:FixJ family two-component response regulator